ncbi:hypothetical protein CIPAW_03G031200 [Carya illinoinensis]|uniref:Uncharacterized protein n=1 Tax=Carya illinoinensis TaxID=32201 RepID=A0A8T1QY52_CARIL|nr:hypothetical protein CIPAW_03G031200 [Carya illinoinensis]KAG6719818.1 hypothetical protein I3842_03G026000 [Carya illinoinensis]
MQTAVRALLCGVDVLLLFWNVWCCNIVWCFSKIEYLELVNCIILYLGACSSCSTVGGMKQ